MLRDHCLGALSIRKVQFPYRVPFTKEKKLRCPCPFKNEVYRPVSVSGLWVCIKTLWAKLHIWKINCTNLNACNNPRKFQPVQTCVLIGRTSWSKSRLASYSTALIWHLNATSQRCLDVDHKNHTQTNSCKKGNLITLGRTTAWNQNDLFLEVGNTVFVDLQKQHCVRTVFEFRLWSKLPDQPSVWTCPQNL